MNPTRTSTVRPLPAYETAPVDASYLSSPHLVINPRERVFSWQYTYVKRAIDLIGATILTALVAVPSLMIAAAIALTSPGPIFYREERLGRNGVLFRIWKFRTMRARSEDSSTWGGFHVSSQNGLSSRIRKNPDDPRITKVGRFLRQWSLDELPQLLNIFAGDMSLVGPRPIIQAEAPRYADRLRFYLAATPGLSGLWQVSGRCLIDYAERTRMDMTYVRRWTLMVDLGILLRTIPAVLCRVGAW